MTDKPDHSPEPGPIPHDALKGLAVVPPQPDQADRRTGPAAEEQSGQHPHSGRGDAGTDVTIAERLARDPTNEEARLDAGVDESMDASDPPAAVRADQRDRPGGN